MSPDKDDDIKPDVNTGEWVSLGSSPRTHAVVTEVYPDSEPGRIEVVYLDDRDRAIQEDVVWEEEHWQFKDSGPVGGYADRVSRLSEFVAILRRGRHS